MVKVPVPIRYSGSIDVSPFRSYTSDSPYTDGYNESRVRRGKFLTNKVGSEGARAHHSLSIQGSSKHEEGRPVDDFHFECGAVLSSILGTVQSYRDILLHSAFNVKQNSAKYLPFG